MQPVDSEYKEGSEYVLSEFVKEGSYGEVHSAQDVSTGFKFAVKKVKQCIAAFVFLLLFLHCLILRCALIARSCFSFSQIALKRFSSEEVGAWSALRSPRVVELFGVVREGPNVLLFMDLKSGTQASALPLTHVTFFNMR